MQKTKRSSCLSRGLFLSLGIILERILFLLFYQLYGTQILTKCRSREAELLEYEYEIR